MSDAVLEKLVEEVVALRRRVAHLETLEPALPSGYYSGSVKVQYQNGVYFPVFSSDDVGGSGIFLIVLGDWSSWDKGGDVWWCWVSALCSIRHDTNADDCISVPCHFASHAMNSRTVALRTRATWMVAGGLMYLEMCVSESVSSPVTIPWRALRLF